MITGQFAILGCSCSFSTTLTHEPIERQSQPVPSHIDRRGRNPHRQPGDEEHKAMGQGVGVKGRGRAWVCLPDPGRLRSAQNATGCVVVVVRRTPLRTPPPPCHSRPGHRSLSTPAGETHPREPEPAKARMAVPKPPPPDPSRTQPPPPTTRISAHQSDVANLLGLPTGCDSCRGGIDHAGGPLVWHPTR